MLLIEKDAEPNALRQDRIDGNSFEGRRCKIELNEALLKNQGHLCVYCMKYIEIGQIRVEHYKPRRYEDLLLCYKNLFLACKGNEGTGRSRHTCDVKKGENEIDIDPLNADHIQGLHYGLGGNIASANPLHDMDLNQTLNLNEQSLLLPRRIIYDEVLGRVQNAKSTGLFSIDYLKKLLAKYIKKRDDKLLPFCGVAIWYLKSEISLLQASNLQSSEIV
jgi:uncharacterized protein (TIGR02646 family)